MEFHTNNSKLKINQTQIVQYKTNQNKYILHTFVCLKYLGRTSATNLSLSLTTNASPLGNQLTICASSLTNISINLRGKGLECPARSFPDLVLPPPPLVLFPEGEVEETLLGELREARAGDGWSMMEVDGISLLVEQPSCCG